MDKVIARMYTYSLINQGLADTSVILCASAHNAINIYHFTVILQYKLLKIRLYGITISAG